MTNITHKLRDRIKLSPVYEFILPLFLKTEIFFWHKRNKGIPIPQRIKQEYVKKYAKKYRTPVLVETGTYLGNMISATIHDFRKIYTVEIDDMLFNRAKKKFSKHQHISVMKGDSAKLIPKILRKIKQPALFWLDAHDSKDITGSGKKATPIMEELQYILHHQIKKHVILIDDAANFSGAMKDYPTLKKLRQNIKKWNSAMKITVKDGIIFIHQ